jgi:hypothetical protein
MFGAILGRKKEDISEDDAIHAELVSKISKMNLTEMRSYVNNNIKDLELSEDGLSILLQKLTTKNEKKEYYLKSDDMDSKKKKAFDLILLISKSKKMNFTVIEEMQKFIEVYKEVIAGYDSEHKEIYASRFVDAINHALVNMNQKVALKNKMDILGENNDSL